MGIEQFAGLVDRQHTTVVGQRVDHHSCVLAGFNHFVEIADRAAANRAGQRAVAPDGGVIREQIAADQIGGGQVLMAGDRDQRHFEGAPRRVGLAKQPPGHVFDEAGLAAARRALEQHRQTRLVGGLEDLNLIAQRQVPGLIGQAAVARLGGG